MPQRSTANSVFVRIVGAIARGEDGRLLVKRATRYVPMLKIIVRLALAAWYGSHADLPQISRDRRASKFTHKYSKFGYRWLKALSGYDPLGDAHSLSPLAPQHELVSVFTLLVGYNTFSHF